MVDEMKIIARMRRFLTQLLSKRLPPEVVKLAVKSSPVYLYHAIGMASGFIFYLFLGRLLGPHNAGVFLLVFTIVTLGSVVSRLGLDTAVTRFASAKESRGGPGSSFPTVFRALVISELIAILIAAVLIASGEQLAQDIFNNPAIVPILNIMALSLVPLTGLLILGGYFKGIEDFLGFHFLGRNDGVYAALSVALVFLFWLGATGDPFTLAIAHLCSTTLLFTIGLTRFINREFRNSYHTDPPVDEPQTSYKSLLRSGLPLFLVASGTVLMHWTDTILIGWFLESSDVGIYEIAFKTASVAAVAIGPIRTVTTPKFSAHYDNGNKAKLKAITLDSARLMTALTIPFFLLFIFAPNHVLTLLYGPQFSDGAIVLVILSGSYLFTAATSSNGYLLAMSGNETTLRNIVLMAAGANLLLNFSLIPTMGLTGAAIATALSICLKNILGVIAVERNLDINIFEWIVPQKS